MADGDRDDGEDADRGEDELRVLPGEVGESRTNKTRGETVPDFKVQCFEKQITAATIELMGRREYGQPCSFACALDRIGERWSLLIVRELMLGPLRFSELARAVGGAPTDVLTKRLRDLEADGIVRRRELDPPASATAYELTELGRGLERPLLELGRWGLNFHEPGERRRDARGDAAATRCA